MNTYTLERLPERPGVISIDDILPLEEDVCLEFEGRRYIIPNNYPTYGLFKRNNSGIIAVQLREPESFSEPLKPISSSCLGILHILEINEEEYTLIGRMDMLENMDAVAISIQLNEKSLHQNTPFMSCIGQLGANISFYRFHKKEACWGALKLPLPLCTPVSLKEVSVKKTIHGCVKHSNVKSFTLKVEDPDIIDPSLFYQLSGSLSVTPPILTEPCIIQKDGREYFIHDHVENIASKSVLPIIGVYSHPFDNDKIVLARILEKGRTFGSRNHILVTEVSTKTSGESEKDIGWMYFRILENRILADGFDIGSRFMSVPLENAQQNRGQGLGSRVLESAEYLFQHRYGKRMFEFETEMDSSKPGMANNRGSFFRNNGYERTATKDNPAFIPENGVLFRKKVA